jgi:hypothetical protein
LIGDSGAWIIERRNGQLCGHVLAWSERKQVAYICPIDVLLADIVETLDASEVRLPGGDVLQQGRATVDEITDDDVLDLEDLVEEEDEGEVTSTLARSMDRIHLSSGIVS